MHFDLSGLEYLKPTKSERDVKKTPNNAVGNFVMSLFSGRSFINMVLVQMSMPPVPAQGRRPYWPRNFQRQVDVLDPVARSAGFSFAPTTVSAAGTARP
jgi:hypothetical protein